MASRSVTFRLKQGSALERYLERAPAKTTSDKLHELAAAHEAVMAHVERTESPVRAKLVGRV